ncbi:tRNA (adenine(22)-N(1))-methyltransferase [Peribacillus butanolivorans]|uniref:tRNA (Adenine-N(1))-methyltransferase n=1 Tax=Peribacillus butanolivorans TaxID=421767 RepID=A0ABM6XH57_9BACI|nr:tRNA (adenine(22)-N(1))-methyltransferase TrmK [Peribacillus butanolivorans]AXN37550.1 tRNA (adenine-N(1))-methyltransferase [Peribacillus butanolivorans]QNU03991.1 tRNA (adenine-N(1))-methyltransferase [Peribacillus butanolivorans]
MNHEKLSMRLERVAIHIPKGSILADIGSDHAYLPCYAVSNGLCDQAIAGEVVEGPYQSARKQVAITGLQDKIEVRKGNGLEVLNSDEATCITIAGMGGTLISSILESGKEKLGKAERLILQPNVGAANVRSWLIDNGWALTGEEILEEDGKIYEILIAEKGDPLQPYHVNKQIGLMFGPFLTKQFSDTFIKKWQLEKRHLERIIEQLDESGRSGLESKRNELEAQISVIEEVLKG